MNDSITVMVCEEYERPLPWRKWSIQLYKKRFVEPRWMLHLRIMWLIWRGKLHTIPLAVWYDKDTDSIKIERARKVWTLRWWPYLIRSEYGEFDREIEIEFNYWWMPADPSVGYDSDYPEWEIVGATYCDTGEPYKGVLDVWNDDIGQYISDNCW